MVFTKLTNRQFRLLGFLPLTFFLAQAIHYWHIDQLGHMLWMCNIGNLLLAIGLALDKPVFIRVAVMWMVPGLFVWAIYVPPTWGVFLTGNVEPGQFFGVVSSTLAHLGGLSVGIIVLRRVGMDDRAWLYAFIWYFVMQFFSRMLTTPDMNVNLSHRIQEGFEPAFSAYWKFWLVLTLLVGVIGWLLGRALQRLWPARRVEADSPRGKS